MSYGHLTQDERYQIAALSRAGWSAAAMARGWDDSTIGREQQRSRDAGRYRPAQA